MIVGVVELGLKNMKQFTKNNQQQHQRFWKIQITNSIVLNRKDIPFSQRKQILSAILIRDTSINNKKLVSKYFNILSYVGYFPIIFLNDDH